MSDGVINEWIDKQGNTAESQEVARMAVAWILDEPMPPSNDTVTCNDCGKEDEPQNMVYQGKDGVENTAPGSAFDYYLCQECEDFYRKEETADDGDEEDE